MENNCPFWWPNPNSRGEHRYWSNSYECYWVRRRWWQFWKPLYEEVWVEVTEDA